MRIDRLEIENFKLFVEKSFPFHPEFNLLIGINGSGKTSLLRAIAVALGGWAHAFVKNEQNLRPILDEEIREIQVDNRFDKTKATTIKAYGNAKIINRFNKEQHVVVEWERSRNELNIATTLVGKTQNKDLGSDQISKKYPLDFNTLGQDILSWIESGSKFDLPIIAFYECDRLWLAEKPVSIETSAKIRYSRFDPYVDCFHTGADDKALSEWILKNELASLQQKQETNVLQSIKAALKNALEGCTDLRFDFEQSRIVIEFDDGRHIPFEHLSDGQRTILALFGDIARRAAILNPHLADNANSETQGVVLIDELDLHLHPTWQRTVIENLRKTFPKIQFICTTHSPFLIQSLRSSEELIMLDGQPLANYAEKSLEEIAKNMGVNRPEVSVRYQQMKKTAKTYLQLLDEAVDSPEEKQAQYKNQLAKLIAPYADNPAYQAFLELKNAVKLGER